MGFQDFWAIKTGTGDGMDGFLLPADAGVAPDVDDKQIIPNFGHQVPVQFKAGRNQKKSENFL